MESDVTQSALFYKTWAWADKNRKQLLYGLIGLVVVGIILAFYLAHASEKQTDANDALSKLTASSVLPNAPQPTPDALLKVNSDYPDTDAGQRALLLAAGDLFASGKYDIALAQFQKFIQNYANSPLVAQAALGAASCSDALGKTNDAIAGYQSVADRYTLQNVAPQARLGLARLLEAQGKFKEARAQLEEASRSYPGTVSSEAVSRLQELLAAHPELNAAVPPAGVPAGALTNSSSQAVSISKTSSAPVINLKAP
ncbi:MAG TPA: tetratricopeptide repeat protein [Verrucomicrobiae bacterium]|nr:tetratricopeptide repeat protein [Verrucomicrobiae bacterium]